MVGKNNQYIQKIKQGTKVETYSIKKFKVGIASVAIGCSVFFGAGVAMAGEQISGEQAVAEATISKDTPKTESKPDTETVTEKQQTTTKVENNPTQPNAISEEKETEKTKAVVNTKKLEDLLSEIDKLNLSNYTEESVKVLQEKVAQAKEVLTNAKTQKEIDSSYNALVAYKNSGLKRAPKPEENNTPKPDTTNGKETLSKKAGNTEPNRTNIAGHNHSMNRTSLPEGSGFRAAPNNEHFRYETTGADLSNLVAGEELGYGKKVIIKIKYDQGTNTRNIQFSSYPNVGPRIEYTRKQSDGIGPYEDNGINIKLVGILPNDMIGTYKLHLHILDRLNNNRELATLEIPITVKPKKPTVRVDNLENAEGKTPTVTANVANTGTSKAIFYLNGNKQSTVDASNGIATWTPTAPLKVNDVITVKNIAKAGIAPTDAYGNTFTINEAESAMSDAVTIPKAPTPVLNKDGAKNEVNTAFTNKTNQIDQDNSLTNEEKTEVKGLAKTAKDNAIQNIENAQDETALNTAKNNGITNIGNVVLPRTANKAAAIETIKAEVTKQNGVIDGKSGLTTEEVAALKQAVSDAATTAKAEINKAETDTDAKVTTAKETGISNIEKAATKAKTNKAAAIEAIEAEVTKQNGVIEGNNGLTSEEVAALKQAVSDAATTAKAEINKAETDTDAKVTTAKETGIGNIGKAATKEKTNKELAVKAIDDEVTKQNGVIDGKSGLTSDEVTALKQAVSNAATTAKENINKAETNTDAKVTTAKETGILAINKAEAIAEIKAVLEAKEKATDEDKSLTKGQKTSIKEIAKKEAMVATVKIKAATTNKEVEEAKNEGIEKIKAAYAKNAELAAELTLPKLIITKWEDEEGNELRAADAKAPAEPGGANEALAHGEIAGYEFVATRDAGEVVTHIFRKLPKKSPIVEERQLSVVEKVNTKTVLPNTGANTTNTGLAGLGLSVLGAVLMTARQRRKNK